LYADWENQRAGYDLNTAIIDLFWSGVSVFDISEKLKAPYEQVRQYVMQFVEHNLVEARPLSPLYFRKNRDGFGYEDNK
jgi:hypothetical protein